MRNNWDRVSHDAMNKLMLKSVFSHPIFIQKCLRTIFTSEIDDIINEIIL